MADVFVSYAHSNRKRVEQICAHLKQAGFDLWWDDRLRAGDDFSLVIERELHGAKCVVVAWSEAARNSLWVRAEATEALDANKLSQVRLDDVRPPLPFTVVEMTDLSRWRGGRDEEPFPRVEAATRAMATGQAAPPDPRVFSGPALQDMGSSAMVGWTSIGLVVFVSALTLQSPQVVDAQTYGLVATASFAAACVCAAMSMLRLLRTLMATGRRT